MALDSMHSASSEKQQGIFGKAISEVADFGEGIFHGAIENPVNGVVQIANHLGAHLSELHIVDQEKISDSTGGKLGETLGGAADLIAATYATRGMSGNMLQSTARMATIGGVYSGVFQPSDPNSKNFWGDRLSNAAVTGLTFGAMGAAGAGMERFGLLSSAEPSLLKSMALNGTAGAAGGLVHAEANAVFKQGRAVPTFSELAGDVTTYGAFGAALGASTYALDGILAPKTIEIDAEHQAQYAEHFARQSDPSTIVDAEHQAQYAEHFRRISDSSTIVDAEHQAQYTEYFGKQSGDAPAAFSEAEREAAFKELYVQNAGEKTFLDYSGNPKEVQLRDTTGNAMTFMARPLGGYDVWLHDASQPDMVRWNGEIVLPSASSDNLLTFKPATGDPIKFDVANSQDAIKALKSQTEEVPSSGN